MLLSSPKNEYPRFIGDLLLEHPNWKEGEPLPTGWQVVTPIERPETSDTQVAYETGPVEVDGVLTQGWAVRELTEEEIEQKNAPQTAKEKLVELGFTDAEIFALMNRLVR